MTVAEWTSLGVWAQAVAVGVAVIVAVRQLREASTTRKAQSRAYVVVYFDLPEDRRQLPDLVVTNLGQTAAKDIRLVFVPQLRSSVNDEIHEVGMLASGIPTLVPGQRLGTFFDSMLERPEDWEDSYEATVSYTDMFGEKHQDKFVLDLGPHQKSYWIDRKGVHDLHERLKGIEREIKHLHSGFGGRMEIVVEERQTYIDRQKALRERQRRRRVERAEAE